MNVPGTSDGSRGVGDRHSIESTLDPNNHFTYVVFMLVHRLRRWPSIKSTSGPNTHTNLLFSGGGPNHLYQREREKTLFYAHNHYFQRMFAVSD